MNIGNLKQLILLIWIELLTIIDSSTTIITSKTGMGANCTWMTMNNSNVESQPREKIVCPA